ncbi:MAG: saccharopine dehydrogenase NADP-binding domain-containing protein [Paenisporosarcina sp.]
MNPTWMIYGANGYTGNLMAEMAVERGLTPILAGRNREEIQALAGKLKLEYRVFPLDKFEQLIAGLSGVQLVLHCAGPFSKTSSLMIEGCLHQGTHYLDITGEINVFEYVHSSEKKLLPTATHLSLGFDSDSGISPGTLKTMIQGLASGSAERRDGIITEFPLGTKQRVIDFGRGSKTAIAIPWGDVSTAYYSTGIPNINTWIPMPTYKIKASRVLNKIKPVVASSFIQRFLNKWIDSKVSGPTLSSRKQSPAFIWGEAHNAQGEKVTVRIKTANVYTLTIYGALEVASRLLLNENTPGGSFTPATLFGPELIENLPESSTFQVE